MRCGSTGSRTIARRDQQRWARHVENGFMQVHLLLDNVSGNSPNLMDRAQRC